MIKSALSAAAKSPSIKSEGRRRYLELRSVSMLAYAQDHIAGGTAHRESGRGVPEGEELHCRINGARGKKAEKNAVFEEGTVSC